ncbi:hypothetical protein Salat_0934300 [Sesamum alatum]|uniref:Uncharacterized protein n=1 Tax=Sesamum alatum TaxID=300844 RepID=A0AAE1YKJ5_9LAMI|nr:hypothetical protein Salat_0934300 [Sesamum alatum]
MREKFDPTLQVFKSSPLGLEGSVHVPTGSNTRQLSSNALDLNAKAEDDEADDSSDVTRETTVIEQQSSLMSFLKKIKNCMILNRNSEQDKQAREMFLSKFRRSF